MTSQFARFTAAAALILSLAACAPAQIPVTSDAACVAGTVMKPAPQLSDPAATAEARQLYHGLHQLAARGIAFGHQDSLAYGMGWKGGDFDSDVYRVCGDFPAVLGWDIGHLEDGDPANIDGVPFADMEKWIKEAYRRNAINTVSWHMRHPVSGTAWTTDRVVYRLLPGGDLHAAYLKKLDRAADFFARLKGDRGELIPLVFRPFHEQSGGWFWWGSQSTSPEEYRQLWRFTADYLRETKQQHQLLFCFAPDNFKSKEEYLKTWPGDSFVDILGLDDYTAAPFPNKAGDAAFMLDTLIEIADAKNKIAALTETGVERIPNPNFWTGALLKNLCVDGKPRRLAWVLVWRNGRPDHYFGPYPGQTSAQNFIHFKDDPATLFLSDMPKNLYH